MNKPLFDNRQPVDGHPDFLKHAFETAAEQSDDVKDALQNALSYLELQYKSTATVHDAESTVKGIAMSAEFLTAAERVHTNITKSFEARSKALNDIRARVEAKIAAVLADPNAKANVALYSEIRQHVAKQPQAARSGFVTGAIQSEDRATLAAVLGAPAYLSGLEPKAQANFREMAAHRWAKAEVEALKAVDAIAARVQRTQEQSLGRIEKTRKRYASDRPAKLELLQKLGGDAA